MLSKKELLTIFALYLIVRIPWIFMVPMVEAPDEFAHFWVLKFLTEHMRLPNLQDVADGLPSAVYGTVPQLGYMPHVICVRLLPFFDITIACRFGSLAMGLVMMWAAWRIGYELFPRSRLFALSVPYIILFHPQIVFVHAYANNDSTTMCLASIILLLVIKMVKNGLSWKLSSLVGILAGWLALSKYSGTAIFGAIGLGMLAAAWIHSASVFTTLLCFTCVAAGLAMLSGWWFYNSWRTLDGDIMGTKTMRYIWASQHDKPQDFYMTPWQVIKQVAWWRMTIYSYWAMFGYMTRYIWRPLYFGYLGFMLLAVLGGAKILYMSLMSLIRKEHKETSADSEAETPVPEAKSADAEAASADHTSSKVIQPHKQKYVMPAVWLTVAVCFLANLAAMVWASTVNLGGPQGRYLMTSEIPIAALIAGGLYRCHEKLRDRLILAFIVFNVIVYIYSVCMLLPTYGFRLKTY